jgi:hypothetical protein
MPIALIAIIISIACLAVIVALIVVRTRRDRSAAVPLGRKTRQPIAMNQAYVGAGFTTTTGATGGTASTTEHMYETVHPDVGPQSYLTPVAGPADEHHYHAVGPPDASMLGAEYMVPQADTAVGENMYHAVGPPEGDGKQTRFTDQSDGEYLAPHVGGPRGGQNVLYASPPDVYGFNDPAGASPADAVYAVAHAAQTPDHLYEAASPSRGAAQPGGDTTAVYALAGTGPGSTSDVPPPSSDTLYHFASDSGETPTYDVASASDRERTGEDHYAHARSSRE